ncbi:MAG: hybrid sensor histidine kinase/response regulator, partial [Chloroflexota bacterium]
ESIHPDDVAATITLFNQLATGEIGQYRLERRHLRKNGETVWTRAAASLVTSSEGLPLYVISIIEDISQRKELEAQLLRAQKLEAAGKIASQVAHDFNNLLGPLVAYPDLIKRHLHAEHPALPLCDLIQEAAETMAVINEDMMALARRGQFDSQPVDLNELIRQVVAQQVNDHDALHVNLELAEEIPPVSGSPAQLSRVISNLICNALEAMQDKGVLTLRTEKSQGGWLLGVSHHLESGEYVRMDVCDTGPGISLENRDKIFDAFFSTKTGQTKRGAGLGLSIVHAIVQDHQGYVDLQSELGKGTIFSVYLPVCRDDDTQEESSDELPRGTERILVVDDDPIQLKVGKKLLKTLGYQVSTVSSGEDALALLRDNPHDLLILDMVMPDGIDGAETYRRALEMKPGQKVIILSGFAQPERMHDALAKGAGVYLRKPVSLEKLARAVRAELDRVP